MHWICQQIQLHLKDLHGQKKMQVYGKDSLSWSCLHLPLISVFLFSLVFNIFYSKLYCSLSLLSPSLLLSCYLSRLRHSYVLLFHKIDISLEFYVLTIYIIPWSLPPYLFIKNLILNRNIHTTNCRMFTRHILSFSKGMHVFFLNVLKP